MQLEKKWVVVIVILVVAGAVVWLVKSSEVVVGREQLLSQNWVRANTFPELAPSVGIPAVPTWFVGPKSLAPVLAKTTYPIRKGGVRKALPRGPMKVKYPSPPEPEPSVWQQISDPEAWRGMRQYFSNEAAGVVGPVVRAVRGSPKRAAKAALVVTAPLLWNSPAAHRVGEWVASS